MTNDTISKVKKKKNQEKIYLSWEKVLESVNFLARKLEHDKIEIDSVYGIPRGGVILATMISHRMNISLRLFKCNIRKTTLLVDDIEDSGKTLSEVRKKYPDNYIYVLSSKKYSDEYAYANHSYYFYEKNQYVVFPWEYDALTKEELITNEEKD